MRKGSKVREKEKSREESLMNVLTFCPCFHFLHFVSFPALPFTAMFVLLHTGAHLLQSIYFCVCRCSHSPARWFIIVWGSAAAGRWLSC